MAKNLHHLLNLFFTTNRGRYLVGPRQAVQRYSKMLQVRRQLELLPILFLFVFTLLHLRLHVLSYSVGIRSHVFQHLKEETVVVCQRGKNISRFDGLAALRAGALHSSLEKIRSVGRNPEAFTNVLLAA